MRWTVLILTMTAAIAGCGNPEIVFTTSGSTTTTASGDMGSGGTTGGMAGSSGAGMGGAGASGGSGTTGGASGGSGGTGGTTGGTGGATTGSGGMAGSGGSVPTCGALDADDDGDGVTEIGGDCDDCDPMVNPGAAEIGADTLDNDCDGFIDGADPDLMPCDGGLAIDAFDPKDAARAVGMCDTDQNDKPKFLSKAVWVLADGLPPGPNVDMVKYHLGHGMLDHFGATLPKEGFRALSLSSGTARNNDHPEFVSVSFDKGYSSNPPLTFSGTSSFCPSTTIPTSSVQDAAGVQFTMSPPVNATGFEFSFAVFSYAFPLNVCTVFADAFWGNIAQGGQERGMSTDIVGNVFNVNAPVMRQCACPSPVNGQCIASPLAVLPQTQLAFDCNSTTLLQGTDFDGASVPGGISGWTNGGTGWLTTTAAITQDSPMIIRFTVFDTGIDPGGVKDHKNDTTVIIDRFRWRSGAVSNQTMPAL